MTNTANGEWSGNNWDQSTAQSLLEALWANDAAGWERLVRQYEPKIREWCAKASLSEHDAADVFQDVLWSVTRRIHKFDHKRHGATFRGWLRVITRNQIIDLYRRRAKVESPSQHRNELSLESLPDPIATDDDGKDDAALSGMVERAINIVQTEFETKSWQAFWRTTVGAEAPQTVAEDLGVSTNSVYVARSRILKRLRTAIGDNPE